MTTWTQDNNGISTTSDSSCQNLQVGGTLKVTGSATLPNIIGATSFASSILVNGGIITSTQATISFSDKNLTTTGWSAVGTASRHGASTLTVHGSQGIAITSGAAAEGGQIKICGTTGADVSGDNFSDSYFYIDMLGTSGRFISKAKNLTENVMIEFKPDVSDTSNATYIDTVVTCAGSSGKVRVRGDSNSHNDKLVVGHPASSSGDQVILFENNTKTSYIAMDSSNPADPLMIGRGGSVNSGKVIEINDVGIGFHGTNPTAQSAAYTAASQSYRNADGIATLDDAKDCLQTLIADLKLTGLLG
tara:strand:+ start:8163 stop:9074 length:912 start_codon:yes stop_codon:yes gene_type:complete